MELTGTKYDNRTDLRDTAKLIRSEIRQAQSGKHPEGYVLPPRATFHVRISRFAHGQAVNVIMRDMPDQWLYNQPGAEPDYPNGFAIHGGRTDECQRVVSELHQIAEAYNRRGAGNGNGDCWFHFDVQLEDDARRAMDRRIRQHKRARNPS